MQVTARNRRFPTRLAAVAVAAVVPFIIGCLGSSRAPERKAEVQAKEEHSTTTRAAAARQNVKREGSKVWIEGMDRYQYLDPMFEGVRIILAHRGEKYSPAYIQGISGSAFRIGGICPCAPTCNNAMGTQELIRLLGYEFEHLKLEDEGEKLAAQTREAIERVKQEVDAGRACLVWHAFTNAEWDVVYGYDGQQKKFLGRGSRRGNDETFVEAPEDRMSKCGHICPPLGVILIGRKARGFEARAAELDALQEAVRHGRSRRNLDKLGGEQWVMLDGIACYDRWIRDFQNPEKKREVGDAYCFGVYHTTHKAAAPFLRAIASRHPEGGKHLELAANHFEREAEALAGGEELLWWSAPEGPDAARNARAVGILQAARDAYAAGIAEIENALARAD
jgi:hypothetical protein